MSISIEMSGHFGFLHVMHHLVEVTLESLFQAVFGLTYILFLASSAGDAVDEVVAVARHVVKQNIIIIILEFNYKLELTSSIMPEGLACCQGVAQKDDN